MGLLMEGSLHLPLRGLFSGGEVYFGILRYIDTNIDKANLCGTSFTGDA